MSPIQTISPIDATTTPTTPQSAAVGERRASHPQPTPTAPERLDARKKIVICCDGTWSVPDRRCEQGRLCPTNVTKTALTIARHDDNGRRQLVYYAPGVGTGRWDRIRGGAFGVGLSRNIREAYAYLVEEYRPGDEIYLFGFSRGAYTVRSLAGLIRNCGILQPGFRDRIGRAYAVYRRGDPDSHPTARESQLFRQTYSWEADAHVTRIKFIGVWDTVGALGIPVGLLGRLSVRVLRLQFHDVNLSSYVDNAFHALAIDERRRSFEPTIWNQQEHAAGQRLEQVWFAGAHSNVGGGNADARLSDVTFLWMKNRAVECGLAFDERAVATATDPDAFGQLAESWRGIYRLVLPRRREIRATGAAPWFVYVHPAAAERRERDAAYDPANLPGHPVLAPLETAPVPPDG